MKVASVLAFVAMVFAAAMLLSAHSLFARSPWGVTVQIAAVGLMIWARFTFGTRSFHPAANPTSGDLVTSGPYRFLRHPIYASIIFFLWAGALDHLSVLPVAMAIVGTAGGIVRMFTEEYFLVRAYPGYRDYMRRTKRLLPGVW